MVRNKANAAFGLIVVANAAVLFYVTTGFEGEKDDRLFPQITLGVLMVLGLVLILSEINFSRPETGSAAGESKVTLRTSLALTLSLGYPLSAFALGFITSTFLFLALVPWAFVRVEGLQYAEVQNKSQLVVNVLYAALVTGFLYLSFDVFLKFSLPKGWLI